MTTLTSREFNQDVGRAKREAKTQPVFVTDRGRPTHVLLSFEAYQLLVGEPESLIEMLAMPDLVAIDLEAAREGHGWDRREVL